MIKDCRTGNPKVELVDKELLYRHVVGRKKIEPEWWRRTVMDEVKKRPEAWQDERRVQKYMMLIKRQNRHSRPLTSDMPEIQEEAS